MRNEMEQIGPRIRALRESRGLSQAGLAAALDIDESAMSRIESGRRGLAAAELALMSEALGVTTDEILFEDREGATSVLLRGDAGPDAQRVKDRVEEAFSDLRYVRSLVES